MVHNRRLQDTLGTNYCPQSVFGFPPLVFCLIKEAGPVPAEGATLERNAFSNIDLSIDRQHKNSRLKLKFQKNFFMNRPNGHVISCERRNLQKLLPPFQAYFTVQIQAHETRVYSILLCILHFIWVTQLLCQHRLSSIPGKTHDATNKVNEMQGSMQQR